MAFHERLSTTQRILLALVCFPCLPFYLCYVCCCAKKKDDGKQEDSLERIEEGRQDAVHGHNNGGFDEDRLRNTTTTIDRVTQGTAEAKVRPKTGTPKLSKKSDLGKAEVEVHPKTITPKLPKKSDLGKAGEKTEKQEASYENRGFVDDRNTTQSSKAKEHYVYPWDRSNLKSLRIDLNKFKQLDAYASTMKVRSSVELLVQELLKQACSDIEKLRAVWMWVTHHIEYDVKGLHNANLRSTDPEDILRTGKGVCAGYSALFQKMCSLAGVECVVISGYAKGINYFQGMSFKGDSNHAWNAVKLQGRWHLLDSTWGAGDVNDDHFTFKYKEFYFLTHPALFIGNHFPKEGTWQLLNPRVSLRQFENALYKCNTFYDLGLLSITPDSPVIQAGGNGKVTVEVESSTPRLFIHDLNGNTQYGLIMLKPNGMKLDVYPQAPGKHCLKIYGKDSEARNSYGFVCEYQVHCKAINTEMRLPADITNPVGPSWLTESKGLRQPSQRQPLIHTEDGKCSFRFLVDRNVQFMACLATATFSMNEDEKRRHVFLSREGNWLEIRVQLPRAGLYVLNIYSKTQADPSKHYSFICNYLISCTNTKVMWPVFPLAYATWEEDYELVEPLAGVLPANRTVHFKMKIPHVAAVLVGARDHKLSLDTNGYWTGSCSTQGCTDLNVMIKKNPNDCSYSFVLSYQVEKN